MRLRRSLDRIPNPLKSYPFFWVPAVVGVVGTIIVLGLWQELLRQEQLHTQVLVQQEATAIASELGRELSNRVSILEQIAHRWEVAQGTPKPLWEQDAGAYVNALSSYQAIEWVDRTFRVRWVVPAQGNETAFNADLSQNFRRQVTLRVARDLDQTILTRALDLLQGEQGFLACVPLWVDPHPQKPGGDRFDGFILGVFEYQTLFSSILKASDQYKVQIYERGQLLYSQGPVPRIVPPQTASVKTYGADWQIRVFPTDRLIETGRSLLPVVVLWGGLAGAWTLATLVYLGQRSARYAKQARKVNQQLQSAILRRQQAEAQLRDSQERLEFALEASVEGWWDWNLVTGKVDRSSQYLQILGYEVGEIPELFNPWEDAIHPEDAPRVKAQLTQHLQDARVPYACEYRICNKFGEWQWIADYGKVVLRDEQQKPLRMIGTFKDISDRKRAEAERLQSEAALRQSEATQQAIIQAIPDLLMRMQADGSHVEFISNSQFNLVNPEDFCPGTNVYEVLPPDLAQKRLDHIQITLATGIPQVYEQAFTQQDPPRYEEVRLVPLENQEILVMVRDISDRKQAEQDLKQQKEMFQAIVDHIPVMIVLFNDQGQMQFVNPEFERTLGWSRPEWQEQNILQASYPDPIEQQSVLDHMFSATGKWKDLTTLTATGKVLATAWANVRLSGGRFLGIGQDISDRKHKEIALRQAMEAAEAANLAKSMFLANMSHELRTPLNVILGFAQVMGHDPALTSNQRADLQTIRRSGDHLLSLINDILDLSKIEAGHCTFDLTSFDLMALLHSLRTMFVERTRAKGIHLQLEIAPEVPQFIRSDAQKLRQILLNLLSNAIKFTQVGQVMLRVQLREWETQQPPRLPSPQDPISLQFEVSDTGVGIAPEELETIFDAFVQAGAGRKSTSGTGLGLTISQKLLELLGGKISVTSTLGEGSTFTFTLPTYSTSSIDLEPEHSQRMVVGLAPGHSHRRILVVDDQLENRLLLVRLLTQLGLEVREATNGEEAVKIWQDWQPDLTWMDIRMPGLDGYEATKQIRAMEQERSSIIIALTAQASQSDRTLALAAGCNDYISKPFREETLFLKMAEYLGLQYLYAESAESDFRVHDSVVSPSSPSPLSPDLPDSTLSMSPDRNLLSEPWLKAVEEAAVCGDDRAIAHLAHQLPAELDSLALHLADLANQYQFETILKLLDLPV